ncbi:hypothetical protein ACWCSD_19765, partial [Nonomuraea sp. NPDC001684]
TSPDHALLRAVAAVDLPAECRHRLDQLHETMIEPLRGLLAEAGEPHPDLVAHLGWSILGEGRRRLAACADSGEGAEAEVITATTLDVLCRAVLSAR